MPALTHTAHANRAGYGGALLADPSLPGSLLLLPDYEFEFDLDHQAMRGSASGSPGADGGSPVAAGGRHADEHEVAGLTDGSR